jgi:peptide deformylase
MIKKTFETKLEVDIYLAEQKIRMERGYLTRSEREEVKSLFANPAALIQPKVVLKGRKIITNIDELKQPCELATDTEVPAIIKALEETLKEVGGYGLSAPQIGIKKQVAIIRIGEKKNEPGVFQTKEDLINPVIVDKGEQVQSYERCLSLPGIGLIVNRYAYVMVEMNNKKTYFMGFEGTVVQHEIDHLKGLLITDRKYKDINRRKK